jgi:hypothetical protein
MSNRLAAGFDRLAPVYDLLARIAIGFIKSVVFTF